MTHTAGPETVEECRLCGSTDDLSFEHIPPRSAFNNERAEMLGLEAWLERDTSTSRPGKRGRIIQQGSGAKTLCRTCNSRAGRLYVPEMARWARIGRSALQDNRTLVESADRDVEPAGIGLTIHRARPGRFVKQMVTMLLALTPAPLAKAHPELTAFAREPKNTRLPEGITLYLNFFAGPLARFVGTSGVLRVQDGANYFVSELAYPPYAYALVMDEPADMPALPYCDITSFAAAPIEVVAKVQMFMQCGFGHTPLPLDYRSAAAVAVDRDGPG